MSFTSDRKTIWYDVFLNPDHPGVETVTFRRAGMPDRSVVGKRAEHARNRQIAEPFERREETIALKFGRDESHEKGGIATIEIGDTILRAGDPAPYAFTGEVSDITPHSWTIRFARRPADVAGRVNRS